MPSFMSMTDKLRLRNQANLTPDKDPDFQDTMKTNYMDIGQIDVNPFKSRQSPATEGFTPPEVMPKVYKPGPVSNRVSSWLRSRRPDVIEAKKAYMSDYNKKPYVKENQAEYMKEYQKRPESIEAQKEYFSRPEVKERVKEYQQKPEYQEYNKKYQQEYNERRRQQRQQAKQQLAATPAPAPTPLPTPNMPDQYYQLEPGQEPSRLSELFRQKRALKSYDPNANINYDAVYKDSPAPRLTADIPVEPQRYPTPNMNRADTEAAAGADKNYQKLEFRKYDLDTPEGMKRAANREEEFRRKMAELDAQITAARKKGGK